ncbi:sodium:calcium antiporter [Salipaludibacillus agaradhaerens]|uniref:sodium:calcium antiporter n=1 Tax=Salipaludibacillus agaradhaerens TaxID=76935 RepID=UPI000997CA96|nr:sodium:calcium antiporter [Salipaludibacillus agaradhaerens]
MMYLVFIAAAIVTIFTAIKLSNYADIIGERTRLGGMMAGTILLAGATSLPEVTTSLTAITVGNPDIAVSNIFGSNLFNLLILAIGDIYFRKHKIFSYIGKDHLLTGFLNVGLTAIVFIAILFPTGYAIFNIGIEIYLLVLFYILGLKYMTTSPEANSVLEVASTNESDYHTQTISLRKAQIGFFIAALIILIAGSALTISGDAIALATGLSSSFMGTFLIAGATSLPEVVTVIVALQLANYHLAVGNILGSNLFNLMILVLCDIFYTSGPITSAVSPVVLISVAAGILLLLILIGGMLFSQTRLVKSTTYPIPSLILVSLYIMCSYLIFTLG